MSPAASLAMFNASIWSSILFFFPTVYCLQTFIYLAINHPKRMELKPLFLTLWLVQTVCLCWQKSLCCSSPFFRYCCLWLSLIFVFNLHTYPAHLKPLSVKSPRSLLDLRPLLHLLRFLIFPDLHFHPLSFVLPQEELSERRQ